MRVGSLLVAIAIAATVLAFGFVAWVLIYPAPVTSPTGPPGPLPLLSGIAMEKVRDGLYWFNFSVQPTSNSLTWGEVHLRLGEPPRTLNSSDTAQVNLTVRASGGETVAAYDILSSTPGWTLGAAVIVTGSQTLVVTTSLSTILAGNHLWVTLSGYSGAYGPEF